MLKDFDEFVNFCFEHGGTLRNHKYFGEMARDLRDSIDSLQQSRVTESVLTVGLTRLLKHLAPDVEVADDAISVFWQLDNAVVGLLKESKPPLSPDTCPYCEGKGKEPASGVLVRCRFCAGTGKSPR